MARDRQRGRQRRGRRNPEGPGSGSPLGGGSEPRAGDELDAARDAGIEDVAEDRGPEGTTPAPDPLKHASPYIDEAKLAEAGQEVGSPGRGEEGGYPGAAEEQAAAAGRPRRGRAVAFLGHSADELRRVQWPDRRHTGQGTAVTLGFVVLAGGFLGLMDAIWRPIVEAIL